MYTALFVANMADERDDLRAQLAAEKHRGDALAKALADLIKIRADLGGVCTVPMCKVCNAWARAKSALAGAGEQKG